MPKYRIEYGGSTWRVESDVELDESQLESLAEQVRGGKYGVPKDQAAVRDARSYAAPEKKKTYKAVIPSFLQPTDTLKRDTAVPGKPKTLSETLKADQARRDAGNAQIEQDRAARLSKARELYVQGNWKAAKQLDPEGFYPIPENQQEREFATEGGKILPGRGIELEGQGDAYRKVFRGAQKAIGGIATALAPASVAGMTKAQKEKVAIGAGQFVVGDTVEDNLLNLVLTGAGAALPAVGKAVKSGAKWWKSLGENREGITLALKEGFPPADVVKTLVKGGATEDEAIQAVGAAIRTNEPGVAELAGKGRVVKSEPVFEPSLSSSNTQKTGQAAYKVPDDPEMDIVQRWAKFKDQFSQEQKDWINEQGRLPDSPTDIQLENFMSRVASGEIEFPETLLTKSEELALWDQVGNDPRLFEKGWDGKKVFDDLRGKYVKSTPEAVPTPLPVDDVRLNKPVEPKTVAKADTSQVREDFGLSPSEATPEKITEWVEGAKKIKRDPRDVAKEVIAEPRVLSKSEQLHLGERMMRIVESGDMSDEAVNEIADITEALRVTGSEWGRSGVARQILIKANYEGVALKARAKVAAGKELTGKQSTIIESQAKKIEELTQKLQDAENAAVLRSAPKPTKDRLVAIRESRAQALSKLKDVAGKAVAETLQAPVMSLMGAGGAGGGSFRYTGEAFDALKTLAKSYLEEGVVRFDDLIAKMKSHGLPEQGEDFARAARQAMGDYGRELNAGRQAMGEDVLAKGQWGIKDKDVQRLRAQLDQAKATADTTIERLRPKTAGEVALGLVNLPKSLKSSFDISAPGRQGWILGLTNPTKAASAFVKQIKSLGSEEAAYAVQREIMDRPTYQKAKNSGLYLAPLDAQIAKGEEGFIGNVLGRGVGWTKANPFKASERAYVTYLNSIRMDVFDKMARFVGEDPKALEAISNYINVATGRGGKSIPGFDQAAQTLGYLSFSPRFVASRFEYALGQPLTKFGKIPAKARLAIGLEYGKFLSAMGAVYMLAEKAGAKIERDPASSDFMKIRIGDTRIDPGAGLLQQVVASYRIGSGRYKTVKGKEINLKDDKFGQNLDQGKVLLQFARSKASPTAGAAWSLLTGKDYLGDKYGVKDAAADLTIPISMQELIEGMRKDGWSKEDAMGLLNFLGFGTNTYSDKEPKEKRG